MTTSKPPILITDFRISPDHQTVSWCVGAARVEKTFAHPIYSANLLASGRGVAIVEALEDSAPRNALIVDADGMLRFRVDIPFPEQQVQGFADMYYIDRELTAILVVCGRDFGVVIDEVTGKCIRTYETR